MSDDTSKTSHYFSDEPSLPSKESTYEFEFDGRTIVIASDRGVFSSSGLDKGTAVLLKHINVAVATLPDGDIVDVGCGAGPLTMALAARFPDRIVWGIDVNSRALDLTRRNAKRNGLGNVRVATPEDFPATVVAGIWSNPPIRVGKDALHKILLSWLTMLHHDGLCRLVVSKNLGGDSLQRWLTDKGFSCERLASKGGFRVFEVLHP